MGTVVPHPWLTSRQLGPYLYLSGITDYIILSPKLTSKSGSYCFGDKFHKVINKYTILILYLLQMTKKGEGYPDLFMKLV